MKRLARQGMETVCQTAYDEDCVLSKSDLAALKAYRKEKAAGKLIPLEQVIRELKELGVRVGRRAP
jgi:hypothetical protein